MIANRWSASPLRYGGDRGSIAKSLMQHLWQRDLHLLTGSRRTMNNLLISPAGQAAAEKTIHH